MHRRHFLQLSLAGSAGNSLHAQTNAPKRLMLIHGRSQGGRNPEALKAEWLTALAQGVSAIGSSLPASLDVSMPFYGDKLDALTNDIPLSADIQARGATPDKEFLQFQAAFAEELRRKAGVSDEEVLAEYSGLPQERGPQNWRWVHAILRALDKKVPGMGSTSLELFTRDTFLYLTKPGVRAAIDRLVSSAMSEQPTVIVAHSLGTVIAYSVLTSDQRRLQVPLLVTLGSPLAVRAVRDPFRPISYPTVVRTWFNAFDRRDVVSLYPLDANNFPVGGTITNHGDVRNHTSNRHGIVGYLDDASVARRVVDALAS